MADAAGDAGTPAGANTTRLAIGIGLSLTSALMNATGMNLQRLAGTGGGGKDGEAPRSRRWLSILGIFLSTSCGLVDASSYGFAPQSTLAPLGAATLVFNLLLGPLVLGTRLALRDVLYTLVIVSGVVLCISAGSAPERVFTLADLAALPGDRAFQAFAAVVTLLVVALAVHVRTSEAKGRGALLSTGVGYPMIAGLFGGCTVISAKLLTVALQVGASVATAVVPIGACVAFCGVTQIVVNNRGLSKHAPLVLVPVFSSTFVLANAVGAMVVFSEGAGAMTPGQWGLYGAGVLCVIGGVLLMARAAVAAQGAAKEKADVGPAAAAAGSGAAGGNSASSGSSGAGRASPQTATPRSPRQPASG